MKRKVEVEGWDTQLGVWGRGVDPDLFSPARRCQGLRRQLGLGPNDIAVLWLGRVVKEKQPGVWLRVRDDKIVPYVVFFMLQNTAVYPPSLSFPLFIIFVSSSSALYPPPNI